MKRWIGAATVVAAMGTTVAVSWSDSSAPSPAAATAPSSDPAAAGTPDVDLGEIPYSAMSAAEQAVIDHGRNEPGWDEVNDTYAAAGRAALARAKARNAADQLGADNLGQDGVVP